MRPGKGVKRKNTSPTPSGTTTTTTSPAAGTATAVFVTPSKDRDGKHEYTIHEVGTIYMVLCVKFDYHDREHVHTVYRKMHVYMYVYMHSTLARKKNPLYLFFLNSCIGKVSCFLCLEVMYAVVSHLYTTVYTSDGKPSSAKKRRKSASSSLALSKVGSPSTSFNPAAMTERQQMAYLLQMTDPQKKAGEY